MLKARARNREALRSVLDTTLARGRSTRDSPPGL